MTSKGDGATSVQMQHRRNRTEKTLLKEGPDEENSSVKTPAMFLVRQLLITSAQGIKNIHFFTLMSQSSEQFQELRSAGERFPFSSHFE